VQAAAKYHRSGDDERDPGHEGDLAVDSHGQAEGEQDQYCSHNHQQSFHKPPYSHRGAAPPRASARINNMDESWTVDELAHAGHEHLDPAFVASFDDKQGRPDPAEDLAVLAGRGLGKESTVVDLGAGTGQFALPAARQFGKVIAVDVSPAMLEALRDRASELALDNLDCIQAGFLSYEHAGPPADAVYTRNALHQLPDFWKALALTRISAFMPTGGVLRLRDLIYDFQPSQAEAVFARWFGHAATDPARGYTREDFAEHIRTEHSTFRWLFEPMLSAAGFQIATVDFDGSVYGTYTCVKS
jgi:ubiquinone/menaquinone biosynthesis C-methylase UbiE